MTNDPSRFLDTKSLLLAFFSAKTLPTNDTKWVSGQLTKGVLHSRASDLAEAPLMAQPREWRSLSRDKNWGFSKHFEANDKHTMCI